jgi:hypothetical protein
MFENLSIQQGKIVVAGKGIPKCRSSANCLRKEVQTLEYKGKGKGQRQLIEEQYDAGFGRDPDHPRTAPQSPVRDGESIAAPSGMCSQQAYQRMNNTA